MKSRRKRRIMKHRAGGRGGRGRSRRKTGGLKLLHPEKQGFDPVMDMIRSPGAGLSVLTTASLKGFIIELNVRRENAEYTTFSGAAGSGSKMTTPVTSYILKFAILTDSPTKLPAYDGDDKVSETPEDYYAESKLQQSVWIASITGGKTPACPSVANFALFDNNNAQDVVDYLMTVSSGGVRYVFNYFYDILSKYKLCNLGVITMPKLVDSYTLASIEETLKSKRENRRADIACIAQIIRMFLDIGVLHFDLHAGNVMLYDSHRTPGDINCTIIDFGLASNIANGVDDGYFNVAEKNVINQKRREYVEGYDQAETKGKKEKSDYIAHVFDFLINVDKLVYRIKQNNGKFTNGHQMDSFDYMVDASHAAERVLVFDKLKEYMTPNNLGKMLPTTVRKYSADGYFVDFNRPISDFYVEFEFPSSVVQAHTFPTISIPSPPASPAVASVALQPPACTPEKSAKGMCTIMGGGSRRKRHRAYN